jgi:hypothetical protein
LERWLSGRRQQVANLSSVLLCSVSSNLTRSTNNRKDIT